MDGHVAQLERELSRLHLREIQHIVDQRQQHALVLAYALQVLDLRFGHRAAESHLEQLDVARDRVQRRSQLVAHVGDELAFRLVRRLRFLPLAVGLGSCGFRFAPRFPLGLVESRVLYQQRGVLDLRCELRVLERRRHLIGER